MRDSRLRFAGTVRNRSHPRILTRWPHHLPEPATALRPTPPPKNRRIQPATRTTSARNKPVTATPNKHQATTRTRLGVARICDGEFGCDGRANVCDGRGVVGERAVANAGGQLSFEIASRTFMA